MVLSIEELIAAKELDDGQRKVSCLLKLRNRTRSYVVQCLADREIQKEIYDEETRAVSDAYRYNCTVIHSPQRWCQFDAVEGHGWDTTRNQPCDQKLKIGRVVNLSLNANDVMPVERAEINYLQETIRNLRKEKNGRQSTKEKKKAADHSPLQQEIRALHQEIYILKSTLSSKTKTILRMEGKKSRLEEKVARLTNTMQDLQQEIARLRSQTVVTNTNYYQRQPPPSSSDSMLDNFFTVALICGTFLLIRKVLRMRWAYYWSFFIATRSRRITLYFLILLFVKRICGNYLRRRF